MRQQLVGPKAFPIERMLAIFYSIIDDDLEDSIDIQLQVIDPFLYLRRNTADSSLSRYCRSAA
jgi:hypothetical protein